MTAPSQAPGLAAPRRAPGRPRGRGRVAGALVLLAVACAASPPPEPGAPPGPAPAAPGGGGAAGPPGWAGVAGHGRATTTGGAGGPTVVVRDAAALAAALARPGPRVVRLDGRVRADVEVPSDTTLEGAPGAVLVGRVRVRARPGRPVANVVLRGLVVDGSASPDDAVQVHGATHVWIDGCDLRDAPDGLLDVVHGADLVTVSWTRLRYTAAAADPDHRFACLVGHTDHSPVDVGRLRVTFLGCWWAEGVRERMPRVRHGQVDVLGCLFTSADAARCVRAAVGGRVLVEACAFLGAGAPHEVEGEGAALLARGNLYGQAAGARRDATGAAFDPPYPRDPPPAAAVPELVRARAGAR